MAEKRTWVMEWSLSKAKRASWYLANFRGAFGFFLYFRGPHESPNRHWRNTEAEFAAPSRKELSHLKPIWALRHALFPMLNSTATPCTASATFQVPDLPMCMLTLSGREIKGSEATKIYLLCHAPKLLRDSPELLVLRLFLFG